MLHNSDNDLCGTEIGCANRLSCIDIEVVKIVKTLLRYFINRYNHLSSLFLITMIPTVTTIIKVIIQHNMQAV